MNRLRKKQFCAGKIFAAVNEMCRTRRRNYAEAQRSRERQKDKRAELHSLKKKRSELPPSERSLHIEGKTRTEKMSNVSPRSAYSLIPGKSLCTRFSAHAHRSPQDRSTRRKKGIPCKEKTPSAVCRTGFFGIVTQFPIRSGQSVPNSLLRRTNPQNLHPHHSQVNR